MSGNFLAHMGDDLPLLGSQLAATAAVLNKRYIVACTHAFERNLHLRELANELAHKDRQLLAGGRQVSELDLIFVLLAL